MSVTREQPPVHISTTKRKITAQAGSVLIRQAARVVGLGAAIAEHLHLKKRARGLSEAQFVTAMAEAIALGAGCLDDLAVGRGDEVQTDLRGFRVPAPQTAGSFLRRFTLGHIRQLDVALRAVNRRALELLGVGRGDRLTLDFDSSAPRGADRPSGLRDPPLAIAVVGRS